MSLTKEGDKVCRRKQLILFLSLFFCLLVFQPTNCSAEKTYQITETQLTQLEMIFNQLETNSIQSQAELITLRQQLQISKSQLAELRQQTQIAQNSLQNANKSLAKYEAEIKAERQRAKIDKYKYALYGILIGYAIGGIK